MSLPLLAVAVGCLWHGAQIVWVAPTPSQFTRSEDSPKPAAGTPAAFQVFWLDQYAWIGIALILLGVVLMIAGLIV